MQDQLYDILVHQDEITWKSIIHDLINSGEMDPWDIDISVLSHNYMDAVKKLKEHNFNISGKVLLASALLLKIKSDKILTEGIASLDNLMFSSDDLEELEDFEHEKERQTILENPRLTIKTPQARKKRVSVNDLITALEKALEVDERRTIRHAERNKIPESMVIPERPKDISLLIKEVYQKVKSWFSKKTKLTFTQLVGSNEKEAKFSTFVPLLYLANQSKLDVNQEIPFGEIDITIHQQEDLNISQLDNN